MLACVLQQTYASLSEGPITTPEENVVAQLAAAAQDGDSAAAFRLVRA